MKPSLVVRAIADLFLHMIKRYLAMLVFVAPFILFLVLLGVLADPVAQALSIEQEHIEVIIILLAMGAFFGLLWIMIKGHGILPKKFGWWLKWSKQQVLPESVQKLLKK